MLLVLYKYRKFLDSFFLLLLLHQLIMNNLNLPVEITNRIITLVSRATAYQCMVVCKAWFNPAVNNFYNTLNLHKTKGCLMDTDVLLNFQKYRNLVKTLEFGNFRIPKISQDLSKGLTVTRLFSNLPQLSVIDLTNRKDSAVILFALGSSLSRVDVCPHFMKDLQNIKVTIQNDSTVDEQVMAAYYSVCFKSRNSITHMNVYHKQVNHIGYLSNYKKLTHVSIRNIGSNRIVDEERDRLVLSSVLRSCPNLIKLEIFNKPDEAYLRVTKRALLSVLPAPPSSRVNTSVSLYNTKMKSLNLTVASLDTSQMEYIMSYIPIHQLDELTLYLSQHNTIQEWIKDAHAETTALKFVQHLSRTKKLRLQIDSKYSEREELTGDEAFQVNTLLWSVARTLEDNREIDKCHIQLILTDIPSDNPIHPYMHSALLLNKCNLSFDIEILNKTMRLYQRVQYSDFFHQNRKDSLEPTLHSLLDPSSSFLSYWTPDRFIEDITRRLELKVPESKIIKGITFAFINFPHIDYFDIDNNANGDLENIQRVTCSKTGKWFITEIARFSLYKLHLRNASLAAPLIDRISFLLRYIGELVIEDGIVLDKKTRHNRIELDFTRMIHLKDVTFNFPYVLRRYSNTLIQLNVKKNTVCYKSGMKKGKHTFLEVSPLAASIEAGSVITLPRITIVISLSNVEKIKFGTFYDTAFF